MGPATRKQCGNDWAILELNTHPIGIGHFEILDDIKLKSHIHPEFVSESDGKAIASRLVVAGYSGDLNEGKLITMDYGCSISQGISGEVAYDCATYKGSSGSPILAADGPYRLTHIIGVNACGPAMATESSWRDYRDRGDLLGDASGAPVERFAGKALQLREQTSSTYNPSKVGAFVPLGL